MQQTEAQVKLKESANVDFFFFFKLAKCGQKMCSFFKIAIIWQNIDDLIPHVVAFKTTSSNGKEINCPFNGGNPSAVGVKTI